MRPAWLQYLEEGSSALHCALNSGDKGSHAGPDRETAKEIHAIDKRIQKLIRVVKAQAQHPIVPQPIPTTCQAGRDGECNWSGCPQLRDNEPHATGRHCPIDNLDEDSYGM